MANAPCPQPPVLEEFASGARTDGALESHVSGCEACRAAVEEAREVNRFLSGVRSSLGVPDPAGPRAHDAGNREPAMAAGYTIEGEIHRGGQGIVYRAVQTRTNRTVAIKVLLGGRGASSRQKERFEREIRIAAALAHPNIATVYEGGLTGDGRYALVMEHIDGLPLDRWSRMGDGDRSRDGRRRALRQRLAVMAKVCDAVLYAHQHSIVHRDLKPSNILVDGAGEPHILDFGVARDTRSDGHPRLTHTGEFAGTLAYASPEQVSGDPARADTRTDIYSLGVILYELVSGKMPYAVDGAMSKIIRGIEAAEPAPLPRRTRDPDDPWVDGEVSTIILKAMAKDPARRYQTAAALRDDIARYLAGEAIEARRDSTWYVLRKTAARHRVVVAAACLIFVLLAAFGAAMARQAYRLEVRGRELSASLNASNVERGRSLAAAGSIELAEDILFTELARTGIGQAGTEFSGSPETMHAYWAAWDMFRQSRCVATLQAPADSGQPQIQLLYFDQADRRLTAVSGSGVLTSWSTLTWEVVRRRVLVAPVEGRAFLFAHSPDKRRIAVFSDELIRIVDSETGRVEVRAEGVVCIGSFSPDGGLLATIDYENRLCVRDARTLGVLFAETEVIEAATPDTAATRRGCPTFSPDGSVVGVARSANRIDLINARSGALERSLAPPDSVVEKHRVVGSFLNGPTFAPDGSVVGWMSSQLLVWGTEGGAPRLLDDVVGPIRYVAMLPTAAGPRLVSTGFDPGGGARGYTNIWDLTSGEPVVQIKHPALMRAPAGCDSSRLIAVGSASGMVHVYDTRAEPYVSALQEGRVWPLAVLDLSPDGRRVAVASRATAAADSQVEIIDLATRATLRRSTRAGPSVVEIAFARDGRSTFEVDKAGRIRQWDLDADEHVREFVPPAPAGQGRRASIWMLRVSPDGRTLAASWQGGLIDLWDVPSGAWIGILESGADGAADVEFSPDGRALAARHREAMIFWDTRSLRPRRSSRFSNNLEGGHSYSALRWSPTAPVIAQAAPNDGSLQFIDADSGRVVSECPPQSAGWGMAFHPSGDVFVASAWDASIRLWDWRSGRELLSLREHAHHVGNLLLTPDGNTVISSDMIGNVLVWDLTYYNGHIRRELERRIALDEAP